MAEKCIYNHERCEPSLLCGQCPHYLQRSFDRGDTLEYKAGVNDEWHSFSKNTCCDDFKFLQHLQYRVKPAVPEIKTGEGVQIPLVEEKTPEEKICDKLDLLIDLFIFKHGLRIDDFYEWRVTHGIKN